MVMVMMMVMMMIIIILLIISIIFIIYYHCDYDGIIKNCIINHYLESITIVCTYGPIVVILSVDNYGSSTIIYIDNINSKKIQAGKI